MSAPLWQPGHLYLPGDLVQPITAPASLPSAITNPSFDSGATGWTFPAGATVVLTGGFVTPPRVEFTGTAGNLRAVNTKVAVTPGTSITASAAYQQGAAAAGDNPARTVLVWYDAASVEIAAAESLGNIISSGSNGAWSTSSVTGAAPANAAFVAVGFRTTRTNAAASYVDHFQWNLVSTEIPPGLIYKAVQPAAGTSAPTEPVWPTVLGVQVTDNEVIWEAVATSRVTWRAASILTSGAAEPVWPTEVGAVIADGSIAWKCVGRHISDPKCPQTKQVVIAASKVYAADDDIIKFCATVNPLDWSTVDDAGYLPYGLQNYGSNPIAAMGIYRSNLVAFNSEGFQMWQVDEDPANAALLDALPVGSTYHKALSPVSNDLFFLSTQGVRTVGIAGGSTNLAAGDVGLPIDPLVQAAMSDALASGGKVLSTYYPGAGQYWLAFNQPPVFF